MDKWERCLARYCRLSGEIFGDVRTEPVGKEKWEDWTSRVKLKYQIDVADKWKPVWCKN